MAPAQTNKSHDSEDGPLAEYFWIAGLDSHDLLDTFRVLDSENESLLSGNETQVPRTLEETIQEDALAEQHAESLSGTPNVSKQHSRSNSYQKLSRLSFEARSSVRSLDKLTHLPSTRSNATIRRVVSSNKQASLPSSPALPNFAAEQLLSQGLSDADFDDVLQRFTSDREAFYLELNFKSDAVTPRPSASIKPKSRTQRIVAEDLEPPSTPNRSLGTVRRHMSFRDMNSARRQPSTIARRVSTKSARRMSSYNSVMPAPQPLQISSDEHPLKRSFEPVLLDRYPRPSAPELQQNRQPFPDYVPMFAFPNDIHIVSSDTRPAARWHEFFLTGADNTKSPAVCVIIWLPLDRRAADEIEKHCEAWRKSHMSEAERELAASLGERLAIERAKLSQLLAKLPSAESGTEKREQLEDEIGVVEEKIALMSDMLKPLRLGAASRIEGLTDGDTGLWIPRAYGILGRDQSMVAFWKEWLKAIVVPMMDGAILRVPASSPRVGMWQPLERYVYNICVQATRPSTSKIQVEVVIRELRLYAKKEAKNELPGSRSVDLYPLFRCLTVPNVIVLFEYLLAESRIILVSAYPSMLKSASNALMALLWPLEWTGVHIPVLPTRLMEVLEAPIPYICGVVRKNDNISFPQDEDFVMVDLDKNELHATVHPPSLPKQMRRKLMSLLYLAAPHHQIRGVPTGPPAYTTEAFPHNMFASEHPTVFSPSAPSLDFGRLAGLSSAQFGIQASTNTNSRQCVFNAFMHAKPVSGASIERPMTSSTARRPSGTDSSDRLSFATATQRSPGNNQSRFQSSLRDARAGQSDSRSRYAPSISTMRRKASLPFVKHSPNPSTTSDVPVMSSQSTYAPSVYAQSTLAASTIMPGGTAYQAVQNSATTCWAEGHCMQWLQSLAGMVCSICSDKTEEALYKCSSCSLTAHSRCVSQICLPCPSAFFPEQVRAAFVRFFTALFYNYRRFMVPADSTQKKAGLREKMNVDTWTTSLHPEHAEYMQMLKQTQAFDGFIHERETKTMATSESIALFDAFMAARKARSRGVRSGIAMSLSGRNPFTGRSHSGGVPAEYLSDTSTHQWRVISTPHNSERADLGPAAKGREYHSIISRTTGRLEDDLFPPPPPQPTPPTTNGIGGKDSKGKKSLRQRMNGLSMHAP